MDFTSSVFFLPFLLPYQTYKSTAKEFIQCETVKLNRSSFCSISYLNSQSAELPLPQNKWLGNQSSYVCRGDSGSSSDSGVVEKEGLTLIRLFR